MRLPTLLTHALLAGCSRQPPLILHIRDLQFITPETFASNFRGQQSEMPHTEIERRYAVFLNLLETVQNQQVATLRELIRQHGIRHAFVEGVTRDDIERFERAVARLPNINLPELQRRTEETDDFAEKALLLIMIVEMRTKRAEVGAVGRLMKTGAIPSAPSPRTIPSANSIRCCCGKESPHLGIKNRANSQTVGSRTLPGFGWLAACL